MNISLSTRTLTSAAMVGALTLSSCSDTQPQSHDGSSVTPVEAGNATRLLKLGDPSTCNAPAVTATVVQLIREAWKPRDWTEAERHHFLNVATMQLSSVTAVEVEAAVPRIACEATFNASEGFEAWENRVGYELTLQLDTDLVNVEVDLRPGLEVLQTTSGQFERDIVEARRNRDRDSQAKEVCDRFMRGRGEWSWSELDNLISDMMDVYNRNKLSLGEEGAACDRLIRADREVAFRAAQVAYFDQQRQAEEAGKARNQERENRVEYLGPPVTPGSRSASPPQAPSEAD